MKTARIAKILTTAALASLGLAAGASQADSYGFYAKVNAPEFNLPARGPSFGPSFCPPKAILSSIDQRQDAQMERITEGVRSGQLTRNEARELIQEQKRIDQLQRRFMADGRMDRGEWAELERRLDEASRDIRAEKHDDENYGYRRQAWR